MWYATRHDQTRMQLEPLPCIARLSPSVVRLLGFNPGPFTLQGTNTYLIGRTAPFVLLDTGQGKPEWTNLLLACLGLSEPSSDLSTQERSIVDSLSVSSSQTNTPISDIVLSHWHHDHVQGLPSVLAHLRYRPVVHKFPFPEQDLAVADDMLPLKHNQHISVSDGSVLQVLHTPGHTDDSVSLLLPGQGIFTADTVLGQATPVFTNLAAYMASLHLIQDVIRSNSNGSSHTRLFPGHGPVNEDGLSRVKEYIVHRQKREDDIVTVFRTHPDTRLDLMQLTRLVYETENVPEQVIPQAARGIQQYVDKLLGEKKVVAWSEGLYSLQPQPDSKI